MQDKRLFEQEKGWLLEEKYQGNPTPAYENDVLRLAQGMPVDYLIGHREFLGCPIDLEYRPLIPRNETEYWLERVIVSHQQVDASTSPPLRVLDMCSGSGCLGIALLAHLPQAEVDLVEYNREFIKQINKNLELNRVDPKRFRVHQSDMFTALPDKQYDLIVANPPYIATDRQNTVQESVHKHEDHGSLYARDDGLYFIKQIIDALPRYLAPGGACYIEYDPWQTELIADYLDSNYPSFKYQIIPDQYKKERVLLLHTKIQTT